MNGLTLYRIEDALLQLMQAREELTDPAREATPDTSAELAAVEAAIREYLELEAPKVDNIIGYLQYAKTTAAMARGEAREYEATARRLEASERRLKEMVCDIMVTSLKKRIEGTTGRAIIRKGNGGIRPLMLQPDMLDDGMCDYVVQLDGEVYRRLAVILLPLARMVERKPNAERIRSGLEAGPVAGAYLEERGEHVEVK